MAGLGVVLGGGGVVGVAWEVGVLRALADAGVEPLASASVVVGTSAGSVVGARLLLGRTPADLEAEQGAPSAAPGAGGPAPDLGLLREVFDAWTSAEPMTEVVAAEVSRLALTAPTVPEAQWVEGFGRFLDGPAWPATDFRATAVRCSTGARVGWSATSGVDLRRAVASSCAVPGMLPAVTVDPASGERYLDGGLWSGTNADLLVGEGLDAVVVVEPMSGADLPLARFSERALAREVAALEADGVEVEVVSPGAGYAALSAHLMDPARRGEGLALGREDGAAAAERVARLVAGLAG